MRTYQRALKRHKAQEQERELARQLRRDVTYSILRTGQFERMRIVIPRWWEWVCTDLAACDPDIAELIDRRLADTAGLASAIIEDWT
jgi:hypothetical protein